MHMYHFFFYSLYINTYVHIHLFISVAFKGGQGANVPPPDEVSGRHTSYLFLSMAQLTMLRKERECNTGI